MATQGQMVTFLIPGSDSRKNIFCAITSVFYTAVYEYLEGTAVFPPHSTGPAVEALS